MKSNREYVTCGNCRVMYRASGHDPRCPACDARLEDYEPLPPMPPPSRFFGELEDPDLAREAREEEPETAPPEEFVAAGLILLSFVMMVVAVVARSPFLLTSGMGLFALTGIGFGIIKLRSFSRRRKEDPDFPSMAERFRRLIWPY